MIVACKQSEKVQVRYCLVKRKKQIAEKKMESEIAAAAAKQDRVRADIRCWNERPAGMVMPKPLHIGKEQEAGL